MGNASAGLAAFRDAFEEIELHDCFDPIHTDADTKNPVKSQRDNCEI